MPKHRVSPVLPPAIVRQPPLLLTSVTRSLYLWELWKILVSIPSPRRLLLLMINQSHERKKDSLPACNVNAWGMALHCWLVTSLCRALCNNIIVYGTSWTSPGPNQETPSFQDPHTTHNTRQWLLVETREERRQMLPPLLCRSLSSTQSSFLWVSSISEALTCWTSTHPHGCTHVEHYREYCTYHMVLTRSYPSLCFSEDWKQMISQVIYKAAEQIWTPISSLGKQ